MNTNTHATLTSPHTVKTDTTMQTDTPTRPVASMDPSLDEELIQHRQTTLLSEQAKPQAMGRRARQTRDRKAKVEGRKSNPTFPQPLGQARLLQAPINSLQVRVGQPRRGVDPNALQELATSIKTHGVLQPILVRPLADTSLGADGHDVPVYEIIAGERRWRASRDAGLTRMPVFVQTLDDVAAAEASLVENLQREDLTPLDTADALAKLLGQGYSVRKLAARLGKQKGWVEQYLALARLPQDLRAMVSGRPDTLTHARELLCVTDENRRAELVALVLDTEHPLSLSVLRQSIKEAQSIKSHVNNKAAQNSEEAPNEEAVLVTEEVVLEAVKDATAEASNTAGTEEESAEEPKEAEPEEADNMLRQEGLLANLRTTQQRLPQLPQPTNSRRRQELVQMLMATRDAITATLTRWEVQA